MLKQSEGNYEMNNVDFSVADGTHSIHFINACLVTPSVFSCQVDCFLELRFKIIR